MPTLSNITVKKYDGTTDAVYVGIAAASADGVPSIHELQTGFPVPATRPVVKTASRNNGRGTARRIVVSGKYPLFHTDSTTGRVVIDGSVPCEFSIVLPQDADPVFVREAHSQFTKLLASAAMRDMFDSGYAQR